MEMVENQQRIRWIDSAKGIAMLCVILGHMDGLHIGCVRLDFVYAFHLTVFFILSGYTLKRKKPDGAYVRNKFCRLMVPYFWTCGCVLVMNIINRVFYWKDGGILAVTHGIGVDLLRSFFASGGSTKFGDIEIGARIGAIWFLPAVFFALILTQLVLNITNCHWKRWLLMGLIAGIGYFSSWFLWFPFSVQSGMVAGLFVLLGYYMKQYWLLERLRGVHYAGLAIIFLAAVWLGWTQVYFVSNSYSDLFGSGIAAVAGSLLVIRGARFVQGSRYLNFVGKHSLLFLCAHLFALETLWSYLEDFFVRFQIAQEMSGWLVFVFHVLFCTGVAAAFCGLKKGCRCIRATVCRNAETKRDAAVDIMRGILIISMLVGHCDIDPMFRKIIYSCHMIAFVVISGYFFKPGRSLKESVIRLARTFLIPYAVFCAVSMLLQLRGMTPELFLDQIKAYAAGLSFSREIFGEIASIGPMYFVLLLFGVRLLYALLDRLFQSESQKTISVIVLSVAGVLLGKSGYWLPWSADCVLYLLAYYRIGIWFRKYRVLHEAQKYPALYFLLSVIWVFMIWQGSMEIAIRQYEPYGLVILGSVSGMMLLFLLSGYLRDHLPRFGKRIFCLLGENTLYILMVHALFQSVVSDFLAAYLDAGYIYHMVLSLFLQLVLGTAVGEVVRYLKRAARSRRERMV